MSDWPRPYRRLDQTTGQPDPDRVPVDLFQHQPGRTDDLAAWADGTAVMVNGGPAVRLPNGDHVGLGDFALRYPAGRTRVEYADGLSQRYVPVPDLDHHDDTGEPADQEAQRS